MIAVAWVTVNHDGRGGTAPDPLVWDEGFLSGHWNQVHGGHISGRDIAAWPYSVGILCRFTSFLCTLHWPPGSDDFGHLDVSFLELLILFEQWAGHRLLSEKVTRPRVRANRPILIPSVCQKELKFDMVANSSVVWFGHLLSCLVVLAGSCLVGLVPICPG